MRYRYDSEAVKSKILAGDEWHLIAAQHNIPRAVVEAVARRMGYSRPGNRRWCPPVAQDPTEEDIERLTAEIRSRWTPEEEERRHAHRRPACVAVSVSDRQLLCGR